MSQKKIKNKYLRKVKRIRLKRHQYTKKQWQERCRQAEAQRKEKAADDE